MMVLLSRVPSSRDPKITYDLYRDTLDPDGPIHCSCPGFEFRSKCRHVTEHESVRRFLGDDDTPTQARAEDMTSAELDALFR